MVVLCCGDRHWTYRFLDDGKTLDKERNKREWNAIWHELRQLPEGTTVIHGDCNGADRACGIVAKKLGFKVIAYPAHWSLHGKKAGPMRNEQMLRDGKPQSVLAFHDDIYNSKGTAHMVAIARESDIPVRIITGRE